MRLRHYFLFSPFVLALTLASLPAHALPLKVACTVLLLCALAVLSRLRQAKSR